MDIGGTFTDFCVLDEVTGADPGPACYGRGGDRPTVTDANLVLGRLSRRGLLAGEMGLDESLSRAPHSSPSPSGSDSTSNAPPTACSGIVVANMVRAIRTISVERGYDPREYTLMSFGGAGPLHARDVALALGMREILVPESPGILCAQGLIVSDLKEDFVASERVAADATGLRRLAGHVEALTARAGAWFDAEGVPAGSRRLELAVDARYVGQNFELAVPVATQSLGVPAGAADTRRSHRSRRHVGRGPVRRRNRSDTGPLTGSAARSVYGGARVGLRVCEPARSDRDRQREAHRSRPAAGRAGPSRIRRARPAPRTVRAPDGAVRTVGRRRVPGLPSGVGAGGTLSRRPRNRRAARLDHSGISPRHGGRGPRAKSRHTHRRWHRGRGMSQNMDTGTRGRTSRENGAVDPITLEIIWNALCSITDETFVALMKSAYSTNIKERRDHSTAIMDASGRLIAQAAQALPIHIASMSGLIACLLEKFAGDIHDGDLFIANDPHTAGGTHLPDINYAMPVFVKGELFGFVANLAHTTRTSGAWRRGPWQAG